MTTSNHISRLFAVAVLISTPAYLHAQSLTVGRGASLVMNEDAKIVLQDAALVNHGSIQAGKSTFIFTGNNISYIGGNTPTAFHHLVIKRPGSQLRLDNNVAVSGLLEMQGGNLELNNRRLDLGSSGSIAGENPQARITGTNGGTVTAVAVLNAPQNANPANLGIIITSAANLGTTTITRGHIQQINELGERSINRYYDIQPSANVNAATSVRLLYLQPELASHQPSDLVLWSKARRFTLGAGTKASLQAYPNPVRDRFTLVVYSDIEIVRTITLQDEHGRVIERKQVNLIAGLNNIAWNMGNRAAGTYNMVIENSKIPGVKVVKQ